MSMFLVTAFYDQISHDPGYLASPCLRLPGPLFVCDHFPSTSIVLRPFVRAGMGVDAQNTDLTSHLVGKEGKRARRKSL